MKVLKFTLVLISTVILISCGGSSDMHTADEKGFAAIEKEIKNKFGDHSYFTDLTITHNNSIGNIIGVTVTDAPESLKMGQWNLTQGNWMQNSEISLEVPEGSKAADFMFQLNQKINLSTLGILAEKSSKQLETEKNIKNPILSIAYIKFPQNGDQAKTEYIVKLQPENGGATFTFSYKLNGDFINLNY